MQKFAKRYPKIIKVINPFLIWDETKRKRFKEVSSPLWNNKIEKLTLGKRKRKTKKKDIIFRFISELQEI